jgi:proteasome lid subunit RPN8/RPN11
MLNHVDSCIPNEGCGLLGGREGRVAAVIPVANAAASPVRFQMDPAQQVRAQFRLEDQQLELVGIFHSHPLGPPGPSQTDLQEAAYPEAVQLIWFKEAAGWECRAFQYEDGTASEVALEVES